MAAMGDVTIGRVAVKVLPDLDGFARSVRSKLTAIERSLDPIEVDVEANTDRLLRDTRLAVQRAQREAGDIVIDVDLEGQESLRRAIRQIDRELEKLRETRFTVKPDFDELDELKRQLDKELKYTVSVDKSSKDSIERTLAELDRELSRRREVKIEVDVDDESLRRLRGDLQRDLDKIKVDVDVDTDKVNEQLARVQRYVRDIKINPFWEPGDAARMRRELEQELLRAEDLKSKIKVEVDPIAKRKAQLELQALEASIAARSVKMEIEPDMDKSEALRVRAYLQTLFSGQDYPIHVRVSTGSVVRSMAQLFGVFSGMRFLDTFLGPLRDMIKDIDKMVPLIGSLTLAMNGLMGMLLAGGANLSVLVQDLARIAPILLPLPGILAGFAIGIGASFAVLKDFNKMLPEVGDRLGRLQEQMSRRFWAVALDPIREAINTLFPSFEEGLLRTTDSLATFYSNLATSLADALAGEPLERMFDGLTESIEIAAKHTDSYATIIRVLGELGAHYLPRLAAWFGDISDQFAGWLDKNLENGNLFDWVDRAIENLGALMSALYSGVLILDNFADAAREAGGSTIQDLARGLANIAEITGSPGFQEGMVTVFRESLGMMTEIANVAGPSVHAALAGIADLAEAVFPSIGRSIGLVVKWLTDAFNDPKNLEGFGMFIEGMEKGLESLATSSEDLGAILGGVNKVMGAIALGGGSLLSAVFEALALVVDPLAETFGELFLVGFAMAEEKIRDLIPLVPAIVESFDGFLKSIIPLVEAALPMLRASLIAIAENIPEIVDAATSLVKGFTKVVDYIVPVLIPVFGFLIDVVMGAVRGLINGIKNIIEGAIGVFEGLVEIVKGIFTGDWERVWEGAKDTVSSALQLIWGVIETWFSVTLLGFIRNIGKNLLKSIVKNWDDIWKAITGKVGFIGTAVKVGWDTIKSSVTTILGSIGSIISTKWGEFAGPIGDFFSGIGSTISNGWQAGYDATVGWLSDMKDGVAEWFGGIGSDVSSWWNDTTESWNQGVDNVRQATNDWFGDLGTRFSEGMSNMGETISTGLEVQKILWSERLSSIGETVNEKLGEVGDFFAFYMPNATEMVTGALDSMKENWSGAMDNLSRGTEAATLLISNWWTERMGTMKETIDSGLSDINAWWEESRETVSLAVGVATDYVTSKWNEGMDTVKFAVSTGLDAIKAWWTVKMNEIKTTASNAVENLKTWWSDGMSYMSTIVNTKLEEIKTWWSNKMEDIRRGASEKLDQLKRRIDNSMDNARQKFNDTIENIKSIFTNGFKALLVTVDTKLGEFRTTMRRLPEQIRGALGSAGTILRNIGRSIIQGLINGVRSKLSDLKAEFGKITNLIPSWKGPPERDSILLTNAGELIMQGLIDGIENRTRDLKDTLQDVTREIEGTEIGAPSIAAMTARAGVLRARIDEDGSTSGSGREFHYHAAPNNSLAEDDLFDALDKDRRWRL